MSIRVALNHRTEYRYDRLVALTPHVVRLRPAPHSRTPVNAYSLKVEPGKHFINWQQDPFGNHLARFVFPERTRRLGIEVDLVAEMTVINPFDFFVEEQAETWPFPYTGPLARDLIPYLEVTEEGPLLSEWLTGVDRREQGTVDVLVALNRRLQRDVAYTVRMEPGVQSCEETLARGIGSCRDSGWLLVQVLRRLGLAARFVSGYLVQLAPDVEALDGPSGPKEDFTDLHAWAEVYVPGAGWIGLDPTSGLFAGEGHIPLACTPEPASAAPVTGATDECEVEFYFHNRVTRVHEDPRVTRPYDEAQWREIVALGRAVDADLERGDVRLTMGGEPTFVSIDDMDGAEWNTAALGPVKRRRALDLLARLQQRFAPGGLRHYGQGKWYPGEPLPRWAYSLLWRADGGALWQDPSLLAPPPEEESEAPDAAAGAAADADAAHRFAHALAGALGVDPGHVVAGHEDVYYYLWREQTLPGNVDAIDNRLEDPLERRRLARLFERGLERATGYALPLAWDERAGGWTSARWHFRRERMFLTVGDSPMGFRLPLDSLPWEPPGAREPAHARDLFEERPPLDGARHGEVMRRYSEVVRGDAMRGDVHEQAPADAGAEEDAQAGAGVVRTALCVEPRGRRLHVFLPPITHLEHWLALLAAVERTAAALATPVVLEGYEPPDDHRLLRLQITADPGVIEVNVHPARSWDQLVEIVETLYAEARLARLGTEKFMLDGRHTGTGGGNHVTIGGPTPADSPVLRRPDLLASLVVYWQQHPSLSYLFSGLFIGPTSQAPRVDEGRADSLYELDIALARVPADGTPAPWVVDRLFRNLLVDLTGNTHRAEFCVDKLYAPDSPAGRRGLVEFRAFEMPPHARMSAVQMLLLRSLIAWFWGTPLRRRPVRWGTELHDRFMLPWWVRQDLRDVVEDLRRAGYPLRLEWFEPFLEFRFPVYGRVTHDGVEIELRLAVEPWHVLGEEATAQGTARYVDSSVERLQVRATGLNPARHVLACNGRRVPLTATGRRGEHVAGVRYKAWQPPSGLHPTLPVHAPLVFDLVDTWSGRSLGGCTYHVAHPGGRSYETFPVNANEAEARRIARFRDHGHTPGDVRVPPEQRPLEYPMTLDLRYPPTR